MRQFRLNRRLNSRVLAALIALPLGALAVPVAAIAHHGFSWAGEEIITLTGTVEEVRMAPPHPTLMVRDGDGTLWTVELSNPRDTARSGFDADSASAGDEVTAWGNRSRDMDEDRMKAIRVTVGGRTYDIYPDRIPADLNG